jgi:hypothetical protein
MSDSIKSTAPPRQIMEQMEAGAFRELCKHLKERSDQVQNIDLMTLAGFCRNCLAKVSLCYGYFSIMKIDFSCVYLITVDGA